MTPMDLYITPGVLKFFIIVFILEPEIDRTTHLEEKAARLKCGGLGKIKIASAGYNTSSLLDTLEEPLVLSIRRMSQQPLSLR